MKEGGFSDFPGHGPREAFSTMDTATNGQTAAPLTMQAPNCSAVRMHEDCLCVLVVNIACLRILL
eukprot:m.163703 g.163703  ORF g.163703 m.163703 type:complete len:65 (-) comp23922_c0_seq1:667-861(-)